uniref:F-box domain-containing protein n=1 Tax=Plectus sambesii TaxID=2011161 RepID=A0A914WGW1_9BILA
MGNGRSDGLGLDSCPDEVLIKILRFLSAKELVTVSNVNSQCFRVAYDELLWRSRFISDFELTPSTTLKVNNSWSEEYKMLSYEVPKKLVQAIEAHVDEVLHVAFSPDGQLMSSCSKDCTVKVWWCDRHPVTLMHERDLSSSLNWRYTQYSQFNGDSSLLLLSGVHKPANNTSGEIAIYSIDREEETMHFRCRVMNRPYDVFGCWFDNMHILNGEHFTMGNTPVFGASASQLWLCKAAQDTHTERTAVLAPFFRFLNRNGANLRMIMVGDYVSDQVRGTFRLADMALAENKSLAQKTAELMEVDETDSTGASKSLIDRVVALSCVNCVLKHKLTREEYGAPIDECSCICHSTTSDRLLIFTTGSSTFTPHQIGFKLVTAAEVLKLLQAEVLPQHRRDAIRAELEKLRRQSKAAAARAYDSSSEEDSSEEEEEVVSWETIVKMFDQPDHTIDMKGHIIGLAISPDHRQLYVNVRPWPDADADEKFPPLDPPPLIDKIELRVIDLQSMLITPQVYRGHKGFTPNEQCFFIFLDVGHHIVCSGSEDCKGYMWSRQYGCILDVFRHGSVVNSVAINPVDQGMVATASDDRTIKIWRSRKRINEMKIFEA